MKALIEYKALLVVGMLFVVLIIGSYAFTAYLHSQSNNIIDGSHLGPMGRMPERIDRQIKETELSVASTKEPYKKQQMEELLVFLKGIRENPPVNRMAN